LFYLAYRLLKAEKDIALEILRYIVVILLSWLAVCSIVAALRYVIPNVRIVSHGAIVAREYGIPAVVNIPGVMKMIKDGQLITVDGDGGKVYL
jgi:hypothetical protein